ncbi:hypothetical protein J1614_005465 [Plenodomus biglobosus]|nr:hypothetical protein J1614_005465 [Plenodomus biglobosus]
MVAESSVCELRCTLIGIVAAGVIIGMAALQCNIHLCMRSIVLAPDASRKTFDPVESTEEHVTLFDSRADYKLWPVYPQTNEEIGFDDMDPQCPMEYSIPQIAPLSFCQTPPGIDTTTNSSTYLHDTYPDTSLLNSPFALTSSVMQRTAPPRIVQRFPQRPTRLDSRLSPTSPTTSCTPPIALIFTTPSQSKYIVKCSLPRCGKTFNRPYDFYRHYNGAHAEEEVQKRHWCPEEECHRSEAYGDHPFPRRDKLKDHLRQAHGIV